MSTLLPQPRPKNTVNSNNNPQKRHERKKKMTMLFEAHDLALGGPKQYEAWFDCGTAGPVQVVVRQSARKGDRILRWQGAAWTPGKEDPVFITPKSDLSVRDLPSDADHDDILAAVREDASLLCERADLILGCVAKAAAGKKK